MGEGREGRPDWYEGMETFGRGGGREGRPDWYKGMETFGRGGARLVEAFDQHDVAFGQLPVAVKNPFPFG